MRQRLAQLVILAAAKIALRLDPKHTKVTITQKEES